MQDKWRVAIIGATGMVGQRFVEILQQHPWFKISCLLASSRSAGKRYGDIIKNSHIKEDILNITVEDSADIKNVVKQADLAFCAISLSKEETRALEEAYASAGLPIISNNSACRLVPDVPMVIPEINADHFNVIKAQQKRLNTKTGFIAVKPNCSIQSFVPPLTPLLIYGIEQISVCTYQAISGAGKTFETWPEIIDNVIPFISGEEEKSQVEPLKVWGKLSDDGSQIIASNKPVISAQCLRVPVSDGHMAAVSVKFSKKPSIEEIKAAWLKPSPIEKLALPSSPTPYLKYFEEENRPQTKLDRMLGNGMGIAMGRLRPDPLLDWRFVCLSHNTLRGAAGGAVLCAEYLCKKGFIQKEVL
ncbi:MAG: aspartate-semialdehyde dehydrogenase [Eubacteriales bacterium]|nr:aspartate-semialdehyde dehydrogenase [Eubacteriales bacterium]